ncbi:MAG: SDR family NAD(P)-dependent oxidoreductase [Geminicoccaceae bacterium]
MGMLDGKVVLLTGASKGIGAATAAVLLREGASLVAHYGGDRGGAEAAVAWRTPRPVEPLALDFPTVLDGARGIRFIEAAVESSRTGSWVDCRLDPC